jgi:hypothetical protein
MRLNSYSITSPAEMTGLVLAFSTAGFLLAVAFLGLHFRAMRQQETLKLNEMEIIETRK